MNRHQLQPPVTTEEVQRLKAGDIVTITGTIYTARDAAHKRLIEALNAGQELPPGAARADHLLCWTYSGQDGGACSGSAGPPPAAAWILIHRRS